MNLRSSFHSWLNWCVHKTQAKPVRTSFPDNWELDLEVEGHNPWPCGHVLHCLVPARNRASGNPCPDHYPPLRSGATFRGGQMSCSVRKANYQHGKLRGRSSNSGVRGAPSAGRARGCDGLAAISGRASTGRKATKLRSSWLPGTEDHGKQGLTLVVAPWASPPGSQPWCWYPEPP